MAKAYGGMSGGMPKEKKKGNPLAGYAVPQASATGKGNPVAAYGSPQKASAGKKASKGYPGIGPAARAKADSAQGVAGHYRDTQRAANKLKRKIKANSGPVGLAGQEQRKLDLARMRKLQAQADRDKARAKKMGMKMGGGSSTPPAAKSVAKATGNGGSGSGSSFGGSSNGGSASPPSTGKPAPRMGAAIRNARAKREDTTGIAISAKELKSFMAFYKSKHKNIDLSRENAVLLARLIKKRGGTAASNYGLGG